MCTMICTKRSMLLFVLMASLQTLGSCFTAPPAAFPVRAAGAAGTSFGTSFGSSGTSTAGTTFDRNWGYSTLCVRAAAAGAGDSQPAAAVELKACGSLTLVGAGPGDPELLTVAAYRTLLDSDMVIADRLISPEILDVVTGELRVANKHPGCQAAAQQEIFQWIREGLFAGRSVVRLKIGDPFVFGRGGEEVLEARRWGVEPKIIPGISSVFSAPLLAGIPVTHRGVANQVTLGTGYGKDFSRTEVGPYHPERTAVFLMAVGRLPLLCQDLLEKNYPGTCPVAIVENASTPRQRIVAGTVNTIVGIALELEVKAPATIVVGEVVTVLHGRVEGLVNYSGMLSEDEREEQDWEYCDVEVPNMAQYPVLQAAPTPSLAAGQS